MSRDNESEECSCNNCSCEEGHESSETTEGTSETPRESTLEEKFASLQNEYLYLRAEFDNYRKRVIKERSDLLKYGCERMVVQILGVFDNFERSLETQLTHENVEMFRSGIEMIAKEFKAILGQFGVEEIDCLGHPFDPTLHEALGSEETSEREAGFIHRVHKKPYKLFDKVIRPGQVIVAKAISEENSQKPSNKES